MKLIDADALLTTMKVNCPMENDLDSFKAGMRAVLERICEAPTVDAEPVRHGEWIRDTNHRWDSKFKCSRCEYETDVDTCFGKPLYNYCPYCGAKMDGERSEKWQSKK